MRVMSSRVNTLLGFGSFSSKRSRACCPRLAEYTIICPLGASMALNPRALPIDLPFDFKGLSLQASTMTRLKAGLASASFSVNVNKS